MKRAVLYLRVSTVDQTTANQERELRLVAERAGWEIVGVYRDHGISGAKGRDKRPRFDALHKAAARREFDVVMAWSVDRLGRMPAHNQPPPAARGRGIATNRGYTHSRAIGQRVLHRATTNLEFYS